MFVFSTLVAACVGALLIMIIDEAILKHYIYRAENKANI